MASEKKPFYPAGNENNVFVYLERLGYDKSKLVKCKDHEQFFDFKKWGFMNSYTNVLKNLLYFLLLFSISS